MAWDAYVKSVPLLGLKKNVTLCMVEGGGSKDISLVSEWGKSVNKLNVLSFGIDFLVVEHVSTELSRLRLLVNNNFFKFNFKYYTSLPF